jgi:hypothetical protein
VIKKQTAFSWINRSGKYDKNAVGFRPASTCGVPLHEDAGGWINRSGKYDKNAVGFRPASTCGVPLHEDAGGADSRDLKMEEEEEEEWRRTRTRTRSLFRIVPVPSPRNSKKLNRRLASRARALERCPCVIEAASAGVRPQGLIIASRAATFTLRFARSCLLLSPPESSCNHC